MEFDKNNNPYQVIGNLKITYVEKDSESSNNDAIRIQHTLDNEICQVEFPITQPDTFLNLIYGLVHLYNFEKRKLSTTP
jgi:hypothetical protein